jgi:hypothetical protein
MTSNNLLQDIKSPINPDDFVIAFCTKFQKWGNAITNELKETWKQNCLAMNNAIKFKSDAKKFVISAPTGSAKTENIITYCAMLPNDITAVISTKLSQEADRLARDINQEAKGMRACSYHSKNKLKLEDASKYQIMVTTHAFYEKHNLSSRKWVKAVGERNLAIIDEALTTIQEISLTTNEVTIALNFFESLRRDRGFKKIELPALYDEDNDGDCINDKTLSYELDLNSLISKINVISSSLDNTKTGTYLEREDSLSNIAEDGDPPIYKKAITLPILNNFRRILEQYRLNPNRILTGIDDESNDTKIQKNILETIKKISFIEHRLAYITANEGVKSLNNVKDHLPKQSVVCFDATADINQLYALRNKYHNDLVLIPRIPNVRDYSNVTLHCARTLTGKNNYNKEAFSSLLKKINFGDKTLFVTNKVNKEKLEEVITKEYSSNHTDITNWGALTGLNKWKSYDTCVLLGLNHKSKQFIQNRTLVNTDESAAFGELQAKLNIDVEISDLTSEIIQAINRIRIRTVTTSDGKCDNANIYITLPSQNYNDYIRLIESHMDQINITEWQIDELDGRKTTFDQIIEHLSSTLKSGDKIKITTPRDELKINNETYRSITGKNDKGKQEFQENLLRHGYEIIEIPELDKKGRTRKNPVKYIFKI